MTKMTDAKASLSAAELALEVAHERIDPDALDRLSVAMQGVELAAALGIADVLPVGSLVAGAGKARLLDEGFEQDRSIGVAVLPVVGQASAHQGKDARGEIFAVDPRQDQEAGIVHDEVQVALSLVCGPTDELVPGFELPGARVQAAGGDDRAGSAPASRSTHRPACAATRRDNSCPSVHRCPVASPVFRKPLARDGLG